MDKKIIYADNAATTKPDERVVAAMEPYFGYYANPSQPYSFSRKAKKAIKEARETIAESINARPDEIFFTSGGTEGDNYGIKMPVFEALKDGKDNIGIITAEFEHHAVLHSVDFLSETFPQVRASLLKPGSDGIVRPEELKRVFSEMKECGITPAVVSVMLVNNELGTIQPVEELCKITKEAFPSAVFHTDAVQAMPHMTVDVRKLGVDILTASAHKYNGPKGTGFMYIRKGSIGQPFVHGGGQESGMRAGTENTAGIVGTAEALRLACLEMADRNNRVREVEKAFFEELDRKFVDYIVNGDDGSGETRVSGTISLSLPGMSGEKILHRLDLMGISVSTGSACNGSSDEISHVLKSIGLEPAVAMGTIRISFGHENTIEEAVQVAGAIAKIMNI